MPNFEETLARMKALYTYGKELNEGKKTPAHTLEYHVVAENGKAYGIVRECNKYFIKVAPKDKETIAEAYDYIGGFNNKRDYEYDSWQKATKNFEQKIRAINEACGGDSSFSMYNPDKKEDVIEEDTRKFSEEIQRQREIMFNTAKLMNESVGFCISRKDGVVKYDGKQPEAPSEKDNTCPEGEDGKAILDKDFAKKTDGVKKDAAPFEEKPKAEADVLKEEDVKEEPVITDDENPEDCEFTEEDLLNAEKESEEPVKEDVEDVDLGVEDGDDAPEDEAAECDGETCDALEDKIAELEAQIADLKAQMDSQEEEDVDAADDDAEEPESAEDIDMELDDIDGDEFDGDDAEAEAEDEPIDGEAAEDEPVDDEADDEDANFDDEDIDDKLDECGAVDAPEDAPLMERREALVNKVVDMVLNEVNEFGKHPGYRKQPLKVEGGEQKPFGEKVGDGQPFNELVDAITKELMGKIASEIKGEKKN